MSSSNYDVSSAANSAKSEIDSINTNREYYDDGVGYLANGNYADALDKFNSISNDYPQYSDVETKISEAKQVYKENAVSWADYYINSNEFDFARNELDSLSAYVDDADVAAAYDRIDEAEDEYYLEYYWRNQDVYIVEGSEEIFYDSGEKKLRMNIHNGTYSDAEYVVLSALIFDSNGNPISSLKNNGTYDNEWRLNTGEFTISSYNTLNMEDENTVWSGLNQDAYYVIACVDYAEFSDGTTWYNPYHDYWLEAYHDSYWDYTNRDY